MGAGFAAGAVVAEGPAAAAGVGAFGAVVGAGAVAVGAVACVVEAGAPAVASGPWPRSPANRRSRSLRR